MIILSDTKEIEEYIDNQIVSYFIKGNLYPFIGAGFTSGSKAKSGIVPNGKECMALMKKLILAENDDLDDIEDETDFDQVASIFYKVVSKDAISDFIFQYFTNVQLEKIKKNFINLKWPYIYTLNIDDAIEGNSNYKPVRPNLKIARKYLNTGTVFKLHGDAFEEVIYIKSSEGIIFSRGQYLKSINQNKDLLNIFLEDYTSKNILFLGCSLTNEIDIEYLLANNESNSKKLSDKIYITTQEPTGRQKIKLKSVGINICLVIDNYDSFYQTMINKLTNKSSWNQAPFQKFLIVDYNKNSEPDFNKKMILGETELVIKDNNITIPDFFIDRSKLSETLGLLSSQDIIFVIGKRVSGKTFFLHSIAKSIKNKNVYLFPSKVSLDSDFIDRLFDLKNSIIIFDSDTINSYDVEDIYLRISDFTNNGISFIFCINSSDRLMLSIPYTKAIDREIIQLDSFFEKSEVELLSKGLSRFAVPNFHSNNNLLNNIINYKNIYRNLDTEIVTVIRSLESKVLRIFILSAAFDKVYSTVFRALNIDDDNLNYGIELSRKSIELEYNLESIELGQHSGYKVITNSKVFLFACLGSYIENRDNMNSAVAAIVDIVAKLKLHDRFQNIYKAVIAFDTLNQIFYKRGKGGAINLIFLIYEKLEVLLYQDTHYWMQRAKSIFYLKRDNVDELLKAIEFAKKPYYDSEPFTRLNMNASYQIAMIYIRVTTLQKFKNEDVFKEAVKWVYITLQENMHNNKVIQNLIDSARRERDKNELYNFCTHLINNRHLVERKERETILTKVLNFKV